jgi:hypothetical protein
MKITKRLILSIIILLVALLLQSIGLQAQTALADPSPANSAPSRDTGRRPPRSWAPPRDAASRTSSQPDTTTETNGDWGGAFVVPEDVIPELSLWELSLSPSIAAGMLEGLEYLIDYPYG